MFVSRAALPLCLSAGLALSGCALPVEGEPPGPGQDQLEIVGGEPYEGDPAVAVLDLGGEGICTGTLVSPRVILTAAHCLQDRAAGAITAHFVDSVNEQGGMSIPASTLAIHDTSDIGAVALAEVALGVTPIPPNESPLEDAVGEDVRLVGFGVTGETAEDAGQKRQGTASLLSVEPSPPVVASGEMVTSNDPQGTCYGDSGGPNLMTFDGVEYVAGVTSRGTDVCGAGDDIAVRVDSHIGWLDAFIQENDPASCSEDGRCAMGCATLDVDCCAQDGACVEECGSMDPECGPGPGEPGTGGSGDPSGSAGAGPQAIQGGCAAGGGAGGAWLALAGLLALFRRRR